MDATARTDALATELSGALTMASRCPGNLSQNSQDYRLRAAQFFTENDRVARAIDSELGELFREDPELGRLVEATSRRGGRKRLAQHLRQTLPEHPHAQESLLSLTQGTADPVASRTPIGGAVSWSRSSGWFSREVVLVLMNVLIVVPIVFAFLTVWGGVHRHSSADDVSTAALRVFIVWVLSFLPSWLYIRFLGQRAGALWSEYVINLHRLAVDEPRYLPRPPKSSEFYAEWLADGGYLQEEEHNIYRQKFNAYYGRAVSSAGGSDFVIKTDTLFPIFLATIGFATCWTAVLWDLSFVENPTTAWDILKFGFLGAYAFTVQSLVRRFFQSDLRPSAYASALLRIIVVFATLVALYQLIDSFEAGVRSAIAFVVGAFPIVGIYALHRTTAVALRAAVPQLTPNYPLNQIDGLNVWYESRLIEEGIEDMQSLVTANLVDVILHTRVPIGRLVDWIDQAQLYFHLDHSEVTRRERRQALRQDNTSSSKPSSEDPSWTAQLSGSLGPGVRAGTNTRVRLRQLGIRTATDLLIAFPPSEVDPRTAAEPTGRQYRYLTPAGIDLEQIRMLVRVLNESSELVPVWNWQRRGARIRPPQETSNRRRINGLEHSQPETTASALRRREPQRTIFDPH